MAAASSNLTEAQIETSLATGENEIELRKLFGDVLYEDLSRTARRLRPPGPALRERAGRRVYILPGIMGSRLSRRRPILPDEIWIDIGDLAAGGVKKLALDREDAADIFASGVLVTAYMRMKLRLRAMDFDAEFLPYDWRRAPAETGATLLEQIRGEGARGAALVGHSMGGLVARAMAALDLGREVVGSVVTVGTPNHGSYSPVQVFRLNHSMLLTLGKLDLAHTPTEIVRDVLRAFPGLLQMMPDPAKRPEERYFETVGWPNGGVRPLKRDLDAALAALNALAPVDDRFHQIVGIGQETIVRASVEGGELVYQSSTDGDGTVPRDLAEQGAVPRYYVGGTHAWLCNRTAVIRAVADILHIGTTARLPTVPPLPTLEGVARRRTDTDLREEAEAAVETVNRPREIDLVVPFVSDEFDAEAWAPDETAALPPGPATSTDRVLESRHGYSVELVARAAANWKSTEAERRRAAVAIAEGHPLDAEDPARLETYARRQLDLVGRAVEDELSVASDRTRAMVSEGRHAVEAARAPAEPVGARLERVIGETEEFFSVMFIKRANLVLRSIARVIDRHGSRLGFGTGFLVAPGVLITNNHVLRTPNEADLAAVQFDYELSVDQRELAGHVFFLNPSRLFETDVNLDFTLVAVEPASLDGLPLERFGHLPLVGATGKIRVGDAVNIVQHPLGERKQVVFRESELKPLPTNPDTVAHYTGDTKPGSSGSPVFSDKWEVVALHHAGVPDMDPQGRWLMKNGQPWQTGNDIEQIKWVANEGIRISRIVTRLTDIHQQGASRPGRDLLQSVLEVGRRAERKGPFYLPPGLESVVPSQDPHMDGPKSRPPSPIVPSPVDPAHEEGSFDQPPADTGRTETATVSMTLPLTVTFSLGMPGTYPAPAVAKSGRAAAAAAQGLLDERRRDPSDYADRQGFDRDFLGERVELPNPGPELAPHIARLTGSNEIELRYDHFSVLMHRTRRMAVISAGNFRHDAPFVASRKDPWRFDPRLERALQIGNELYRHNDLDRGHLFRRADGAWGETPAEARRASDDTFHWTNIVPQHFVFNQSGEDRNLSIWGLIENHLVREAQKENRRLTIFNGPLFSDLDRRHRGVQIPDAYFKVAVVRTEAGLRAFAFVLGQQALLTDIPVEAFDAGRFAVFQVRLGEVERRASLDFGALRRADVLLRPGADERMVPGGTVIRIADLSDVVTQ